MGLHAALSEITLVVFTTLAPPAIFACMLLAVAAAFAPAQRSAQSERLGHMVGLPLALATVGLVASATHLGTPSNALYVFSGVGRSPLSNEVVLCLAALASIGAFWLLSFSDRWRARVMRVMAVLVVAAGAAALVGIAWAYSVRTIVTWVLPTVPVSLILGAVAGGVPLYLLAAHIAQAPQAGGTILKALPATGAVAFAAHIACLIVQDALLMPSANEIVSVAELAPWQLGLLVLYGVLGMLAYAIVGVTRGRVSPVRASFSRLANGALLFASYVSITAGLFCVRFSFYLVHMTAGISL